MIPKKYEYFIFAFFMSLFMGVLMSGVISFINIGLVPNFLSVWLEAFLKAWVVAYPSTLIAVPFVKKAVKLVMKEE